MEQTFKYIFYSIVVICIACVLINVEFKFKILSPTIQQEENP